MALLLNAKLVKMLVTSFSRQPFKASRGSDEHDINLAWPLNNLKQSLFRLSHVGKTIIDRQNLHLAKMNNKTSLLSTNNNITEF